MTAAQNTFSAGDIPTALNEALSFMNSVGPQQMVNVLYYESTDDSGLPLFNFVVVYWQN